LQLRVVFRHQPKRQSERCVGQNREAGCFDSQSVGSRRQTDEFVSALGVAGGGAFNAFGRISHGNFCIFHRKILRIQNGAGQIYGVHLRETAWSDGADRGAKQRRHNEKFAQTHRHTPKGIHNFSPNLQPHFCACRKISVDPLCTQQSSKKRTDERLLRPPVTLCNKKL
jgi:hypothetical protein